MHTQIILDSGRELTTAEPYSDVVERIFAADESPVELNDLLGRQMTVTSPHVVAVVESTKTEPVTVADRARAILALRAVALLLLEERSQLVFPTEFEHQIESLAEALAEAVVDVQ